MIEFEAMALSAELQKAIAGKRVSFSSTILFVEHGAAFCKKFREKRAHLSVKSPQAHAKAERFIE